VGPRQKFNLLNLVGQPLGFIGLVAFAMMTSHWLLPISFIWSLWLARVTNKIQCPHCNHKLYLGRIQLGPLRIRACTAYVGPHCERCGKLVDAPSRR
jgi:hypothetical protein